MSTCRGCILTLFLVGTARCAVRAAFSGAIERGRTLYRACSARSTRAGTAQRAIPTTANIKDSAKMRPNFNGLNSYADCSALNPGIYARQDVRFQISCV